MGGGSGAALEDLPDAARALLEEARRGALATLDAHGRPHVVPVCYAARRGEIVTAIDHKPKSGRRLARLAHVERDARATLMVDRWDEEWTRLAWVMVQGRAELRPPASADDDLVRRYPHYRARPPRGPVIALLPERVLWWSWD